MRARCLRPIPPSWVWRGTALLALVVLTCNARAEPPHSALSRAHQLGARAHALGVARSLAWQRLLHYRPGAWNDPVSQVDGTAFFLSSVGDHDPEAELRATLRAFLEPVTPGKQDEHALCRFPARRLLLEEWLHFSSDLPAIRCPQLSKFLTRLDPESVTVVYSANFLNNPASAFGHTFLRLKKRRPPGSTLSEEVLDHGVEYTAASNTNNPFLYAFKGLTGWFKGVFVFHSFESKVHEYANAEARDLWEYDLNLSAREVQLLTLHLWELSVTHLDYYYLTKNCSYHVLATLEAAVPRIDLVAHLNFVVLPRDTVKALFSVPGLIRQSDYRPSLRSQFRAQVARLNATQRELVQTLTLDPNTPLPASFTLQDRVATLDSAVLVLDARYARSAEKAPDPEVERRRTRLLERRARLSATLPPPAAGPVPYDKAPQRAHGSMRVTLGTGVTSQYGSPFGTLGYRLALHDLTDPPDGEPELSQLQFLDTRLRYDLGQQRLTLDRLTFAELVALTPITRYEQTLSWRGRAFGTRLHDRGCRDCFAHGLELGIGGTLASEDEHVAVFVMANALVAFSGSLDGIDGSFVRAGIGPFGGLRVRLPGACVGLLAASWSYLPGQRLHSTYDVRANLRSELGKDVALGLEAVLQPLSVEAQLASYLYF